MRGLKYRWENILTMVLFFKRLMFLKFHSSIYFELKKEKTQVFYFLSCHTENKYTHSLKFPCDYFFFSHFTKRTVEDGT